MVERHHQLRRQHLRARPGRAGRWRQGGSVGRKSSLHRHCQFVVQTWRDRYSAPRSLQCDDLDSHRHGLFRLCRDPERRHDQHDHAANRAGQCECHRFNRCKRRGSRQYHRVQSAGVDSGDHTDTQRGRCHRPQCQHLGSVRRSDTHGGGVIHRNHGNRDDQCCGVQSCARHLVAEHKCVARLLCRKFHDWHEWLVPARSGRFGNHGFALSADRHLWFARYRHIFDVSDGKLHACQRHRCDGNFGVEFGGRLCPHRLNRHNRV